MVSLAAAEDLANSVWPDAVNAVVAVPDERKGERLLLVTTQHNADHRALLLAGRERGTAEIQVPRDIMMVEKLPMLGTGKINYPAVSNSNWARRVGFAEACDVIQAPNGNA
jgi:acyl-[acyl-carrier-protein]-phospholipid O-acyltransferase/long-chain-fatty-acid--[acyl-carrier-protein] ligase